MPPVNSKKVGAPRLNPVNRLLHRFYEPLLLLSILNPSCGYDESPNPPASSSRQSRLIWRRFLDSLSMLCDGERGGATVCSIIAESTPDGAKFWLAAEKKKSFVHLEFILNELRSLCSTSPLAVENVERDIAKRSIDFGRERVDNYSKWLFRWIKTARDSLDNSMDQATINLLNELDELQKFRGSRYELCLKALKFQNLVCLRHRAEDASTYRISPWVMVRHYIGRLGTWFRVSKVLVRVACRYPELFGDCTAEHLRIPEATPAPSADAKTNLESALKRMLPANEQDRVSVLYGALQDLRTFDIEDSFIEKYSDEEKFKPRIHSELVVLEHIYQNNLEFVFNERYVGCSKPSCYCCGLYMRDHPGNFVLRPCHGNVWYNWAPPLSPTTSDNISRIHTRDMLNNMVGHIRRDVVHQIESRAQRKMRFPDSTTGVSIDTYASRTSASVASSVDVQQNY